MENFKKGCILLKEKWIGKNHKNYIYVLKLYKNNKIEVLFLKRWTWWPVNGFFNFQILFLIYRIPLNRLDFFMDSDFIKIEGWLKVLQKCNKNKLKIQKWIKSWHKTVWQICIICCQDIFLNQWNQLDRSMENK